MSKVFHFRYTFDVASRSLARDDLWEIAVDQHGFVTAQQAAEHGVSKHALQMLVHRGTLDRVTFGVYRFPRFPVGEFDPYMLAVLWTRAPEAALSHETALSAYGISDVNPSRIHVTVGRHRRIRRAGGEGYAVHYEDLIPQQLTWWQEIPTVTPATAVEQCIESGTPTYLVRQAIDRGHARGYLAKDEHTALTAKLENRHER